MEPATDSTSSADTSVVDDTTTPSDSHRDTGPDARDQGDSSAQATSHDAPASESGDVGDEGVDDGASPHDTLVAQSETEAADSSSALDADLRDDGTSPVDGPQDAPIEQDAADCYASDAQPLDGSGDAQHASVVTVCPSSTTLRTTDSLRFTAWVDGVRDGFRDGVQWSASSGSIDADGTFHPGPPGPVEITATSSANPAAKATAQVLVRVGAVPTFGGTVRYAGAKKGRIYVLLGERPDVFSVATSLASAGAFTLRPPRSTNGSIYINAFMDSVGTGSYAIGADPVATTVVVGPGDDFSHLDLTLVDPAPITLPASKFAALFATDGGAIVHWQRVTDSSNGQEVPEGYHVYWSHQAHPSANNHVAMRTVPAGTIPIALLADQAANSTLYAAVAPFIGTTEGPLVETAPVVVGPPVTGYQVRGLVDATGQAPTATLLLFAYGKATNLRGSVVRGWSVPQPFAIGGVTDGFFGLGALADLDGDGVFLPTEPAQIAPWTPERRVVVNGADVAGQSLRLLSTPYNARAQLQKYVTASGTTYGVSLRVHSNLRMPMRAVLTSGPSVADPFDFGYELDGGGAGFRAFLPLASLPSLPGAYSVDVTDGEGVTCNVSLPLTGDLREAITIVAPQSTAESTTPQLQWAPPPQLTARDFVQASLVDVTGSQRTRIWDFSVPATVTSVPYNFDLGASNTQLEHGHTYQLQLSYADEDGNAVTTEQLFDVP